MTVLASETSKLFISWLFRYAHVVFSVAWIGILYYFNFAQVPAFAKMEPAHRNGAFDQLVPRALWYFRYAALSTLVTGILLYGINQNLVYQYNKAANNTILVGMLLGTVMAYNVWMIIWPNQKIAIANARGLLAGKEADPAAAAAGRKGLLASRTNALLSVSMMLFMTAAQHWFGIHSAAGNGRIILFWIISLVIIAAIEANALGLIGGMQGPGTKLLEDHKKVIEGSCALAVVFFVLASLLVLA